MIPWLLILIGGIAIYSGLKGQNPVDVVKGVLNGNA